MKPLKTITVNGLEFKVGDKAFKKIETPEGDKIIFCGFITDFSTELYAPVKETEPETCVRFAALYMKPHDIHWTGNRGRINELIHESQCGFDKIGLGYIEMCKEPKPLPFIAPPSWNKPEPENA